MADKDDGSARKRSRVETDKASPPVRLRLEVGETARGVGHSMLLGGSAAAPLPAGPSGLLDRLKAFLPQLEAANSDLTKRVKAGEDVRIDSLTDEERFIEMNVMLPGDEDEDDNKSAGADGPDGDETAASEPAGGGAKAAATPGVVAAADTLKVDAKQPKTAPRPLIEEVEATVTKDASSAEDEAAAPSAPPTDGHKADKC